MIFFDTEDVFDVTIRCVNEIDGHNGRRSYRLRGGAPGGEGLAASANLSPKAKLDVDGGRAPELKRRNQLFGVYLDIRQSVCPGLASPVIALFANAFHRCAEFPLGRRPR